MNELDEKLSVVLDEYTDDQKSQSVLNEVIGDVNLQYQIRRYQMIGDVLRHELPDHLNLDLSRQIMSKIEEIEVTPSSPTSTAKSTEKKSSVLALGKLETLSRFCHSSYCGGGVGHPLADDFC